MNKICPGKVKAKSGVPDTTRNRGEIIFWKEGQETKKAMTWKGKCVQGNQYLYASSGKIVATERQTSMHPRNAGKRGKSIAKKGSKTE